MFKQIHFSCEQIPYWTNKQCACGQEPERVVGEDKKSSSLNYLLSALPPFHQWLGTAFSHTIHCHCGSLRLCPV